MHIQPPGPEAPRVRVSFAVLNKLAVVASREVQGVEDVEGVLFGAGLGNDTRSVLRLNVTVKPGVEVAALLEAVRKHICDTVRALAGIELGIVEVELA
jgi:uncharacterized alkaline shock family protein YloU